MGGRGGCAGAMEREEVSFVAFVLFFISMIVLRKAKVNMRGRDYCRPVW